MESAKLVLPHQLPPTVKIQKQQNGCAQISNKLTMKYYKDPTSSVFPSFKQGISETFLSLRLSLNTLSKDAFILFYCQFHLQ